MSRKPNIAICDPDAHGELLLRSMLGAQGYDVEVLQDGHEVIDKIGTLSHDLLIISADSPGIDGFQVCRLLKESEKTRHIPAMLVASETHQQARDHAIEAGADEYIAKPFNRVELLARVVALLRIKSLHDRLGTLIREKEEEKKKLAEKTNELHILSDIARIVLSVKDQKMVLHEIVNSLRQTFGVEAAMMVTRRQGHWVYESLSDPLHQEFEGRVAERERAWFDRVAAREKPLLLEDANSENDLADMNAAWPGMKFQSLLCSPVFVRGRIVGLLLIINRHDREVFGAADLSLLMTISGQIALAIENMQLFGQLSEFNKNLQTQIVEATRAIVDLKNFNESIIQNVSSGLLTVDFNGKILFANWASQSILGLKTDDLMQRTMDDVFGQRTATVMMRPSDEIDVAPGTSEVEYTTPLGETVHLGFTTTVRYDSHSQMAGYIISFRDITQIKELRSTIARMDRLVSLGMITSAIAHEIRNPLAGIKTMAQALQKELDEQDPRHEYVQRIIRQINRLNDLLKAFLSYSRPVRPERQYCSLASIVRDVKSLVRERCQTDQIELHEHYEEGLPALFVDENQMEQVLINLVINALDAVGQRGEVTIEARIVRRSLPPRFRAEREIFEIRVRDSGKGIPPEVVKNIFDPFFTTKPSGIGLGLSIVYRIIHEHGGEVVVESKENEGSTFLILLPLHEEAEPAHMETRTT